MRKSLAGDIAKARSAQDFSRVDQLKRLRSEVNREVERLAAEGGPAAGRAKEAIRYDREEFAPFFRQGAGDKLRTAVNRDDLQIGRASCRERVCLYVYISVSAVSLKNNKNHKS